MSKLKGPFMLDARGKLLFDLDYLSDAEVRLLAGIFIRENEARVARRMGSLPLLDLTTIKHARRRLFKPKH